MSPKPKTSFLTVRVTDQTRTKFCDKAKQHGQPSEVLREIVDAFIDDRIKITPPVNRNLESLYVN
jgi:hypothetical protein